MNARVNGASQVTLPDEIVEALKLTPGSSVAFERGPNGEIMLVKAAEVPPLSKEQYLERIRPFIGSARYGVTTDDIMAETRGED